MLLGLVALVSVPRSPSRRVATSVAVAAVAGLVAVTLRAAFSDNLINAWLVELAG